MLNTLNILISGGAGFIGFHLANELSRRDNYFVTVIDNFSRGRMDEDFINLINRKNVKFIEADLTDQKTYISLGDDYDFVYNLAAVIGVRNVVNNPDKVLYTNALTSLYLFEAAKRMPRIKKIFFSSTSEIYTGTLINFSMKIPTPENTPLSLADITSTRTTYMLSKMFGESVCYAYGKLYQIPFTIGRYHNVYGPRMGFQHVIPEMFVKITKNNKIDVLSPNHTRAMCYIDDAIEMTIRMCESENTKYEVLNIGNQSQEIRIIDLVDEIAQTMGVSIIKNLESDTFGSPNRRCPDMNKTINMIKYIPHIDIKCGLAKTFEWYKDKLDFVYE